MPALASINQKSGNTWSSLESNRKGLTNLRDSSRNLASITAS
nr:A204 [uncultured bacterium]